HVECAAGRKRQTGVLQGHFRADRHRDDGDRVDWTQGDYEGLQEEEHRAM
ncbi:uncharacterized protein METZ01_LOCUS351912, partial [marine metagenome]